MIVNEKFFPGGFNPNHPSQNVQVKIVDNEDGTGIKYEYDTNGNLIAQTDLILPIQEEQFDPYAVYAQAIADAQTMEEVRAAGAALLAALGGE